jgi:hypothetical protein
VSAEPAPRDDLVGSYDEALAAEALEDFGVGFDPGQRSCAWAAGSGEQRPSDAALTSAV